MKACPACKALCHDKARFCPSCGANVVDAQASDADPFVGHVLEDKYLIKQILGEGGMGKVYEAEQMALEKPVAIKILHQHLLGDEHSVARFVAEAREASRLNHPNIVSVIEFGETASNIMFLVMEYLRGRPLADVIADEYPLSFSRVVRIFRQVLLAVGAAHQLGVLHRDIKPDNVFIEELADGAERVKVIDFGIAKRFDQADAGLTSPGMVCGTPEYMSPEQVQGDPLDPRSDVYSLGVLLFEMLVGTPPFLGKTPAETMLMQAEDEPLSPSAAASEQAIPASMDAIVLWSLAKDRDDRIESADAFRRVLDSWLRVTLEAGGALEGTTGFTCPSCNTFNVENAQTCISCGYRLPTDRPAEGIPYLRESLGEERFQRMRESQAIPYPMPPGIEELATPGTSQAVQTGRTILRYLALQGREREQTRLLQLLETGGSLRMVGESGIGKSRLLDELASRARDAGFEVLRLSPRDDTRFPSQRWSVHKTLTEILGLAPDEVHSADAIHRAAREAGLGEESFRGLETLFCVPQPLQQQMGHAAERRESRTVLRDLIRRYAEQQPIALLIEDLGLMDAPSRQLFEYLQTLPAQKSVLVVTAQADPPPESDTVPVLELRPLAAEETETLAEAKQQGQPLSPETRALMPFTGGNPFFVDQLVRLEREGGLPGRLKRRIELLDARLDRLPLHLRQLLQRIAVHGGRVPTHRLEEVFGLDPQELELELAALDEHGLVDTGVNWVSASHALVEDAVVAGMPAEIRHETHKRWLKHIPISPETIGAAIRHALGSEDDQTSAELLEIGAAVAWCSQDPDRAIQWLQLAMQKSRLLWGRGEVDMEAHTRITVELGRKLAEVLRLRGEGGTADGVLREVQSFMSLEQPSLAAAVQMDRARFVLKRGNISTAEEQLQQALRSSMHEEEALWLHCELIYRLGGIAIRRGQYERALDLFSEGFSLAVQLDAAGHAEAWRFQVALGELRRGEGKLEEAGAYYEEALMTAERTGSLQGMRIAQTALSELLMKQGQGVRARDHLTEAIRHCERLGDRGSAAMLMLRLGVQAQQAGEFQVASQHLERARDVAAAMHLEKLRRETERRLAQLPSEPPPGPP